MQGVTSSFQAARVCHRGFALVITLSNIDGRLATKPWCFAHANVGASTQKVITEHSSNFSHEIDLQLLPGNTANLLDVDPQGHSNFISGNTGFNGTKFGIQYSRQSILSSHAHPDSFIRVDNSSLASLPMYYRIQEEFRK